MQKFNLGELRSKQKIQSTLKFIERQTYAHASESDGRILHKSLKIPFLKIKLPNLDVNTALSEAQALSQHFVQHRSKDSSGWSSLCIHGIDSYKTRHCEYYGYESEIETPYIWTDASNKCPVTTEWTRQLLDKKFFEKLYRVRFMKLAANGHINFHWDRPPGQNSLGPINFALNMPENCHWLFKDWGPVPFKAGEAYAVDVSNHHGVWNLSNEDRYHIIIHGKYGPTYYNALAEGQSENFKNLKSKS